MAFFIYGLVFGSVALAGLASYASVRQQAGDYFQSRMKSARVHLDDMFLDLSHHRMQVLHFGAPVVLALVAWLVSGLWYVGVAGAAVGLVIPGMMLKWMGAARRKRFHSQLVDCLLLLASCLRAGLSMLQSFSIVVEEMPAPINQEFGLMVKETRMGITLDEAMVHFRQRNPSDDANLFVTAVLVARETGGDVTAVFARLVETLRERKKIRERIKTLTFMAKMQAVIMAALPIVFAYVVYTMDRGHFEFFLKDPTGQLMLAGVVAVQLFGTFLFIRFGRSPL